MALPFLSAVSETDGLFLMETVITTHTLVPILVLQICCLYKCTMVVSDLVDLCLLASFFISFSTFSQLFECRLTQDSQ